MRRGEVRWYRFDAPDKRRPVLILTRDSALEFLGEVTVAPVTSVIRDIPTEVVLGPEDGMPRECAVNLDHVQTVSRGRIRALLTTLPQPRMVEVGNAVQFALGFPAQRALSGGEDVRREGRVDSHRRQKRSRTATSISSRTRAAKPTKV